MANEKPNSTGDFDPDEFMKTRQGGTATATAGDFDPDEFMKTRQGGAATATAEPPTDEEIEASYGKDVSPKIRAALKSGVAPMTKPTQTEIDHPQQPDYYGFTPMNMLRGGLQGLGNVAKFAGGVAKDISDPNRPMLFGGDEEGPKESLLHKYVIHPQDVELEKAENEQNPIARYGHAGAAMVPLFGPWLGGAAEEAGQTGNIGGTVAKTGAEYLGGKALEGISGMGGDLATKAASKGLPAAGEIAGRVIKGEPLGATTKEVVGEMAKQDPNVAAQKAAAPMKKFAQRFQDNLAGARPYLEGAKTLEELQTKVAAGLKEVWKPYSDALAKIGNREVQGPDGLTTLNNLEDKRLELSAERQKLQKLVATDRATALQKDADLRANEQRYKAYQNAIDNELNSAGVDGNQIRKTFGQLKGVQKLIEGRNTLSEADRAYGLGRLMEDFHITKPLRSLTKGAIAGAGDFLAGRPLFGGKPTDVNVAEGFREGTGGPKPDFTAKAPGPQYAEAAGPFPRQYAEPVGPEPGGHFDITGGNQPNRGELWDKDLSQRQVGALPDIGFGEPHAAPEKPLGPITGEQLPLGLPGAHHELFNLPQTPKVGERSYAPEGVKGMLPPPGATELPPPGSAELAHPRMFPQEAGSAPAEPQVFRQPKGKPGAGRMAKGFTSEPVERTVGQTAEGGPIGEAEAGKLREKIDAGREKVGGKGREGLIQPINKTGAADLKVGDTFVDEKGDPRRITDIGEDGKIKTADHTLRDYESGEIKHLGEINSPKAQLARGGMFHPTEEVPETEGDRYDLGEIEGSQKKTEEVKPMEKPGEPGGEVKPTATTGELPSDEEIASEFGTQEGAKPRTSKPIPVEEATKKLQDGAKDNEHIYQIHKPGQLKPGDLGNAVFLLHDGSALQGAEHLDSHMAVARAVGQDLLNDANAVRVAGADSFEIHGMPSEAQLAEMNRLYREVAPQDRQTVHGHNVYWDFYPRTADHGYSADAIHAAHSTDDGSFSDFRRAMDDYYQPAKVEPEKINAQGRAIFSKPPESEALEAGREKVPAESEDTFKPDDVRVSTRVPSSVNAEDAHTKPMEINMEAIKDKDLPQRLVDTVKNYPGMKEAFKDVDMKDPNAVLAKFVEHVSNNLEWLHNQMPEEVRKITRQWYDSANQIATENAKKFGHTMQQASGVLAVLSPQKDWFMNKSLAERVQDIHANQQDTVFTPEMKAKAKQLAVTETKNVVNKTIKRLLKDYEDDLPDDVLDKAKDFAKKGQRAAAFEVLRDATGLDEEALPVPKQRIGTMAKKIEGKTLGELDSKGKAAWIRIYDEAHNPREFNEFAPDGTDLGTVKSEKTGKNKKVAWGGLNSIEKAVNILEDGSRENISRQLGEEHKVRNFYNNIADPNSEHPDVTIDTHAVAAGHISPFSGKSHEVTMNFSGPGSDITGSSGTYALNAEAYRQAAARLGIKPRELQSIVWEQIRDLFPAKFKTAANMKAVANIWKDYGKGNISLDEARNQVVQKAGGFKTPDWLEKLKNAKK